jgi:hypothetical protein
MTDRIYDDDDRYPTWSDRDRLAFCAALFELGIQYLDFKAFCRAELDSSYPSSWSHQYREQALENLKPEGHLRDRYDHWNAEEISSRAQERDESRPYKTPARPIKIAPVFVDDDIPY